MSAWLEWGGGEKGTDHSQKVDRHSWDTMNAQEQCF